MLHASSAPTLDRARARWLPLWLVGAIAPLVVVAEARAPGWLASDASDVAVMYVGYAAIAAWVLYACAVAGVRPSAFFRPAPTAHDWRALVLAPALVALSLGGVYLVWLAMSFAAPGLVASWLAEADEPTWIASAPLRSALAILAAVVVAPVVEEVLFRGVLLHRWAAKWTARRAVVVSSLLFGVLHGADVIGATVFGLVLAMLYVRAGTLWAPIGCHVLNNLLGIVADLVAHDGDDAMGTLAELRSDWYEGALVLAVGAGALYALRRLYLPPAGWRLPALASVHAPSAAPPGESAPLSATGGG